MPGNQPGLLSDNRDVMNSLLAALCDPGSITPRAPRESLESWQRRAVIEHAAPYIQAAERERITAARLSLFVAIRHAIPVDAPWRREALDLITTLLAEPEGAPPGTAELPVTGPGESERFRVAEARDTLARWDEDRGSVGGAFGGYDTERVLADHLRAVLALIPEETTGA